jgi:predicted nucleic acid-binding protein
MISLPTGPLLFDTGIYIRFSRGENYLWLGDDARVFQRTILTAVVAAELYAGTHNRREKCALDALCQAYHALGHFSSPSTAAWIDNGILLCRARSVFGEMEFVRHFRDLLIAMEVVRAGATLVTENVRDFSRWRSLLASARKTLKLFNPSPATLGGT